MLKVLIEKDDFYSKESNPHLVFKWILGRDIKFNWVLLVEGNYQLTPTMPPPLSWYFFVRHSLASLDYRGTTGKNLHFSSWILIVPADFLEQIRVTQGLVPSLLLLVTISTIGQLGGCPCSRFSGREEVLDQRRS
ncbi:uncharacterized protein LOC103502558 isoform X2 [Cucumis melo]|uniref:Uncharacterized protein LOC103502558 isoform X2 n=1 Tax=Cucumis melo TaxID=3656 RepID=A0ABM3L8Y4_CUCME|nr:uncharacterized protein LOC103502558 isoform X2 [Cucumis melo]